MIKATMKLGELGTLCRAHSKGMVIKEYFKKILLRNATTQEKTIFLVAPASNIFKLCKIWEQSSNS